LLIELCAFKLCKVKNEYLSDSTYFEIDLSCLWQDIENLQKHAELSLIERRAAYRRFPPMGGW
jgi:hypothetical protein